MYTDEKVYEEKNESTQNQKGPRTPMCTHTHISSNNKIKIWITAILYVTFKLYIHEIFNIILPGFS